jgi:glutaredoxin-like protein
MRILSPEQQRAVREDLAGLERPVELALVLGPEAMPLPGARDIDFSGETQTLLEELTELTELLTLSVHDEPAYGAERFPAICVLPAGEDAGIRYYGLPWGYELMSVVGACVEASRPEPSLRADSVDALATLERPLSIDVFVTPTCPHCPRAVLLAYRCAFASPLVSASAIDAVEFPALAEEKGVWSVPKIVVDGTPRFEGALPEAAFIRRLLTAAKSTEDG